MIQHKLDTSGRAYSIGKDAEDNFVPYAEARGWAVKPASPQENMKAHFDFVLTKDKETYKVEVKAQKRVNRGDSNTQTELIWLEYLGGSGATGWLMAEATHIAFQDGDGYMIIPRQALADRAATLVTDKTARNASDALYKLYTRFNRKDLLTMVKKSDIEDLAISL